MLEWEILDLLFQLEDPIFMTNIKIFTLQQLSNTQKPSVFATIIPPERN